jgi:TRAP-type C4-dicarboxylate transport system permease small subunit
LTTIDPKSGLPASEGPGADPGIGRIARSIAIVGGLLSVATALLVTASVTGRWLGYGAINGDFELVQVGVALSVFCFLPLTQARRGNIVVDSFTTRLPTRLNRAIDALWDFVYAGSMALLAWCLMNGARDALASGLTSTMVGMPLWPVFAACVLLVVFLAITAVDTGLRLLRDRR